MRSTEETVIALSMGLACTIVFPVPINRKRVKTIIMTMHNIFQLLTQGLDLAPIALLLNRVTLGTFYLLARFRFFYDPSKPAKERWLNKERSASLTAKMQHCGFTSYPYAWAWIAASIEVIGGGMLIAGVFSAFAALGLSVLTLFATRCTWRSKVYEQNPVDCVDVCSCYLWRVEGLYILMALIVILAGPGGFTVL